MTGQSGGTTLPGVASDGNNGVLAQNFTAYPVIADPTEGPILTAVSASDFGETPLPAGEYSYAVAYEDLPGNRTNFTVGGSVITLDGTQIVQVEPPASLPSDILFVGYARFAESSYWIIVPGTDVATPFIDFIQPDALVAQDQPINVYNQTYPTAVLGPTTVNGSLAAATAVAQWGRTPPTTQPALTSSRASLQDQIDDLVALLASLGTLVDQRTA